MYREVLLFACTVHLCIWACLLFSFNCFPSPSTLLFFLLPLFCSFSFSVCRYASVTDVCGRAEWSNCQRVLYEPLVPLMVRCVFGQRSYVASCVFPVIEVGEARQCACTINVHVCYNHACNCIHCLWRRKQWVKKKAMSEEENQEIYPWPSLFDATCVQSIISKATLSCLVCAISIFLHAKERMRS